MDADGAGEEGGLSSRRIEVAARLFLLVGAAAVLAHFVGAVVVAEPGLNSATADWLYCSLFLVVAASCGLRAARERRAGGNALAWAIAAAGVTLWGLAEISYRLLEADPGEPYPLATQGLLAFSFTLASVTLLLLSRDRIGGVEKGPVLDGLIGGLAVAAVGASLLFPVAAGEGVAVAQPGPPAVFLLVDLMILAFVVTSLGLTGWRPGACWGLMCAGIVVNTIGNVGLVHASEAGTFHRGSPVDSLYLISALLLGLAAWYPIRPPARQRTDEVRRVAAPLAFGLLALCLLLIAAFEVISPVAVLLAAASLGLVVLRTALAFRDNGELLRARERDALTDGLTGLGNRRRLMRDLGDAVPRAISGEAELSLMLFDLDGFKSYNDAFGHTAGDALLARLGSNLRGTVDSNGDAYRMGGDEFCVIARTDSLKTDAILAGACEALSESFSGFTVRPSYGVVALAHEARTVAQALQLADQRMYRQKNGRPGSVTRDAHAILLRVLRERDAGLDDHMHAVASLARRVGEDLKLDNEELDVLTRAAELHDIGKMATPDAILHKAGPLSQEEWEIMRRHTVIGEKILNSIPALRPVAKIVRSTHERIDGHGYPDELPGERIPLPARIVAVCDAYHAMTTERSYDELKSTEAAVAELRRCAGTQFDAEIVEIVCRLVAPDRTGPQLVKVNGAITFTPTGDVAKPQDTSLQVKD